MRKILGQKIYLFKKNLKFCFFINKMGIVLTIQRQPQSIVKYKLKFRFIKNSDAILSL